MSKFDIFVSDLEGVIAKLSSVLDGGKQMRDESEAVEKGAQQATGTPPSKKGRRSSIVRRLVPDRKLPGDPAFSLAGARFYPG